MRFATRLRACDIDPDLSSRSLLKPQNVCERILFSNSDSLVQIYITYSHGRTFLATDETALSAR